MRGFGRALLAGLLSGVLGSVSARAEPDQEGCKDGVLARLPSFFINDCEVTKADHYVFADGTAARRDIAGDKARIAYALNDGVDPNGRPATLGAYARMFREQGWSVVASGDSRWITARRGAGDKTEWVEVSVNGLANYEIVQVTSPKP